MSDKDKENIKRFINNTDMSEAVRGALLRAFLKKKSDDVNYLAASMIAVNLLNEAFEELKKVAIEEVKEKRVGNVGL